MSYRRIFILFLLWIGAFSCQHGMGARPDWCSKWLAYLASDRSEKVEPQLETVDDMLWAFSNGLVPDPHSEAQLRAFEVYLKMRFGESKNASNDTGSDALRTVVEKIAKKLREHPELAKIPLRNFMMSTAERSYPVTTDLQGLTKSVVDAAGVAKGNLFQIEANLGYWKKVFGWQEADVPAEIKEIKREWSKEEKDRVRKARKDWEEGEKARFIKFLDGIITKDLRDDLANSSSPTPVDQKAATLFVRLNLHRKKLVAQGTDSGLISQTMADLVHTIGFHNKEIQAGLKSPDGMRRVAALKAALEERDQFAMSMGYPEHFDGLLHELGLSAPSGMDSNKAFVGRLTEIEQDVISKATIKTSKGTVREIRQLSVMEAPFRSCIGGSDCSSRTYLTRALDPNYQYFTMTDGDGYSSGHMTVVLGSAGTNKKRSIPFIRSGSSEENLAFVDKIMNVPNEDLPIMIEAVRRSLLEKGYTLVMPEDLGDNHSGLSNSQGTIDYVGRWIAMEGDPISGFKPHSHDYSLDSAHSRAGKGLVVRKVAELKLPEHVQLSPTEEAHSWKTGKLDLNQLVLGSRALKAGDTDSKVRYIEAQKTIKSAGLELDPEFRNTIDGWLADQNQPFRLRKRILLYQWLDEKADLPSLLKPLTTLERIDLVQNILDTPRLKEIIFKNRNQLPQLMVEVRSNKKLVTALAEGYGRGFSDGIGKVLEASDISDGVALKIIKQIKESFTTWDMNDATQVLRLAAGTSIEPGLRHALMTAYINNVSNPTRLAREVVRNLASNHAATQDFARAVLKSRSEGTEVIPMIRAISEIEGLATRKKVSHREASEEWVADKNTDAELKAEYLRAHITSDEFERLEARLPKSQRNQVVERIHENSMGLELRQIAKQKGVSPSDFAKFTPEGFEHVWSRFPKEGTKVTLGSPENEPGRYGSDENQRAVTLKKPFLTGKTPVTQWLYALVMEENPSRFKDGPGSIEVAINGKKIQMRPNNPVEQVTWEEANEFCKRFTKLMNNGIKYQLPLEARTESVLRAGSSTRFPFGDNEEDLPQYAWFSGNSENSTHPVAELKPNASGHYDTQGNVWEWQRDWYTGDTSKLSGVDPEGPSSGSGRVFRGGGWGSDAQNLRSAGRSLTAPGYRNCDLGFRLEGTPE